MKLSELPQEENGALGLGLTVLLLLSVALWLRARRPGKFFSGQAQPCYPGNDARVVGLARFACNAYPLCEARHRQPLFPRNLLPWSPALAGAVGRFFGQRRHSAFAPLAGALLAPLAALSVVPVILLTPSRPLISAAPAAQSGAQGRSFRHVAGKIGRQSMMSMPDAPIRLPLCASDLPPDLRIAQD